MANKTVETDVDVSDFVRNFASTPQKQEDSFALIGLMQKVTGYPARMWGPSIIGFGRYHYRYSSGHEGDAPLLGFSPRKAAISLYVHTGLEQHAHLLAPLGKCTVSKACIYVKKLADIDVDALTILMQATVHYLRSAYPED